MRQEKEIRARINNAERIIEESYKNLYSKNVLFHNTGDNVRKDINERKQLLKWFLREWYLANYK